MKSTYKLNMNYWLKAGGSVFDTGVDNDAQANIYNTEFNYLKKKLKWCTMMMYGLISLVLILRGLTKDISKLPQ